MGRRHAGSRNILRRSEVTTKTTTGLIWFRRDLRTTDNQALSAAAKSAKTVVALYILNGNPFDERRMGAASRWWLHNSLSALRVRLDALNIPLILRRGDATTIITEIASKLAVETVYCSHVHEPLERRLEENVARALIGDRRSLHCSEGSLIHPPGTITNREDRPYRVFTPYWNMWKTARPTKPVPEPAAQRPAPLPDTYSDDLDSFRLLPRNPDWSGGLQKTWDPGEIGAEAELDRFIENVAESYEKTRDVPSIIGTSRLSPHLHFGEISPTRIWHTFQMALSISNVGVDATDTAGYLRQLCWREFNHDILARHPEMAHRNIDTRFDAIAWRRDPEALTAWQKGRTGYPVVDAGMRELWTTGWMHNRVRMIVASFLTKHLLIDWRDGEHWFWDTLVDADLANNAANWQWVAGSGMDAAPYFRIFNPVLQGQRFDAAGDYVRKWLPERTGLNNKEIHLPDSETGDLFSGNYPGAIVEHKIARQRALEAFKVIKRRD